MLTTTMSQQGRPSGAIAPVADFEVEPPVLNGVPAQFTDLSTNTPTSWDWDFGDGGSSSLQNPTHTFGPGEWTVSLVATNAAGSDIETKVDYITVI